jgi:hypothetical protein
MNKSAGRELSAIAGYLTVDVGNARQLADLAAVAVTRLAWRDGVVEAWHRASPTRIVDHEMMRANAATTRLVRRQLADAAGGTAERIARAFGAVGPRLADPGRRLPDGRTVGELAPDAQGLEVYGGQVRGFVVRLGRLVERLGPEVVVGALACYAAAACWQWWLAPGWPSMVEMIMRNLEGGCCYSFQPVRCSAGSILIPGELDLSEVRRRLVAGPDRLSATEARYCLLGSHSSRLPQDHGLSPRSRRMLPPTQQHMIKYLDPTGATSSPTTWPGTRFQ